MRLATCIAAVILAVLAGESPAELKIFSIPQDISWGEAQQGPISEQRYLDLVM